MTEKELSQIDRKAEKAKMSRTDYLIASALNQKITVIENLTSVLAELHRIGNNINQLTRLANAGAVFCVGLEDTVTALGGILEQLSVIGKKE